MIQRFLVLTALTLVAISPALNGGFLYWDDSTHVVNNPQLVAGNWFAFWQDQYYRLYIPVIYTVWTWLFMISQSQIAFHVFNACLHGLNGVMFFKLATLVVPEALAERGRLRHLSLWLATLAFMFHPLQTEPVAWIAGARDLLSTSFAMGAALIIWQATRWPQYALATVLFTLSLLSKAATAPLPVALLVIPAFRTTLNRTKLGVMAAWLPVAGVILYINKMVQQADADNLIPNLGVIDRLLTVIDIFGFYTQKFVVPWPMSGDYGRIPSLVLSKQFYLTTGAYFLVAVAFVAFCTWRWRRFPLFGILFYGLMMSPVSGVVKFMAQSQSSVADRYVYLAWAGPCWMILLGALKFPRAQPVLAVVILVWGGLMFTRSGVYKDNATFFTDMLTYNPDSFVGHTTMGVVDFTSGKFQLAEQHFKDANRLMPLSVSPIGNLAQLYLEQKRFIDIVQIVEPVFEQPGFIAFNKSNVESVARCARVIGRAHVYLNNLAAANRRFCQALALNPTDGESQSDYRTFVMELQRRSLPVDPCPPITL